LPLSSREKGVEEPTPATGIMSAASIDVRAWLELRG
jgi:hypothetical protein